METVIGIIGAFAYLGIIYLVMDLWGHPEDHPLVDKGPRPLGKGIEPRPGYR